MFQKIKVWGFRHYYRIISARSWKGHSGQASWNPLEIPGGSGPIHARMYSGDGSTDKPVIVYFHGGGWVIGDLDTATNAMLVAWHLPIIKGFPKQTSRRSEVVE